MSANLFNSYLGCMRERNKNTLLPCFQCQGLNPGLIHARHALLLLSHSQWVVLCFYLFYGHIWLAQDLLLCLLRDRSWWDSGDHMWSWLSNLDGLHVKQSLTHYTVSPAPLMGQCICYLFTLSTLLRFFCWNVRVLCD